MQLKKRKLVSLSTKLDILQEIDAGESIRAVAERLRVSKGTVQAAKKSRQSIEAEADSNRSLSKGRLAIQSNSNVLLWRWFSQVRQQGFAISRPVLQGKALEVASRMGMQEFKASQGWLDK